MTLSLLELLIAAKNLALVFPLLLVCLTDNDERCTSVQKYRIRPPCPRLALEFYENINYSKSLPSKLDLVWAQHCIVNFLLLCSLLASNICNDIIASSGVLFCCNKYFGGKR